jgi:glutamine synthetase
VDNRFECRAVGASANCAALMTVLNTIVANQLQGFAEKVDRRNQQNPGTEDNIVAELQGYMDDVDAVVFNGNGYSRAWEEEAEARGLSNNKTTPSALKAMISESTHEAFRNQRVFSKKELHSRYEMLLENYVNKIAIEADLFQEMSKTYVLPAAYQTINNLSETYRNLNEMGLKEQAQNIKAQVVPITELIDNLNGDLVELLKAKSSADNMSDPVASAEAYADQVKPYFDKVRASIDTLEGLVDSRIWQLPKYRELVFFQ